MTLRIGDVVIAANEAQDADTGEWITIEDTGKIVEFREDGAKTLIKCMDPEMLGQLIEVETHTLRLV